jgi:hypothetical protein
VTSFAACPEPTCSAPASVTPVNTYASTSGPVDVVSVACVEGHRFRMAADSLPTT